MKKTLNGTSFCLLALVLALSACSSKSGNKEIACDQHPDIRYHIDQYLSRVSDGKKSGVKTVDSDRGPEVVNMGTEDMSDSYEVLYDLDIELPNLLGRYGCEFIEEGAFRREHYFALDSQLKVRQLTLEFQNDQLQSLTGLRKVGSVLASVRQRFNWEPQNQFLEIKIDYRNLFGREYDYRLTFEHAD